MALEKINKLCSWTLGFVFIFHGLIPKIIFQRTSGELQTFIKSNVAFGHDKTLLIVIGICEIAFGIILIWQRDKKWPFLAVLAGLPMLTIGAYLGDHATFIRPFNPITFNLALMILAYIALLTNTQVSRDTSA